MNIIFNKRLLLVFILTLLCGMVSDAADNLITQQITIKLDEAGTLPNRIGSTKKYLITNLKIIGEINGTDMRMIRDMAGRGISNNGYKTSGKLSILDLSEAKIVKGGDYYYDTRSYYDPYLYSSEDCLGSYFFCDCSGLTSVNIPSSVTEIGDGAFSGCLNLETVYFEGKYCKSNYADLNIPTTSIIKVPTEFLQEYKNAFGSDYKYIYAWNPDETGDDNKPVTQCSTPSVSYGEGKLMFACETTGAKYHYTITDTDIKSDALSENGEVSLSAAYNISVYATADGYKASDKAEATLYWINANLDTGTNINMVKTRGVVASAHDGIITLSGLDNGEVVKFYATDGKYLGSSVAANGTASYAVNESLVIAKVGKDSIKIAVK